MKRRSCINNKLVKNIYINSPNNLGGFTFAELESSTDYYPFGMEMPGRTYNAFTGSSGYRYTYQGQYAEKDALTGWNEFEARMWDARLGRWYSPDPAGQFHSPYLGMGNNPVSTVDPDGEWVHIVVGAAVGGALNVATNWNNIDNFWEGAAAFTGGAGSGALTAAFGPLGAVVGGH